MTTVAYRDGVIASDSLVTNDNGIGCGHARKIVKGDNVLGGASGPSGEALKFLQWVKNNCDGDQPVIKGNTECILVKDGVGHYINKDGAIVPVKCDFMAIGSGEEIAFGAMAMGATAQEAVKIAIQIDTNSGGEIRTLKI